MLLVERGVKYPLYCVETSKFWFCALKSKSVELTVEVKEPEVCNPPITVPEKLTEIWYTAYAPLKAHTAFEVEVCCGALTETDSVADAVCPLLSVTVTITLYVPA